VTSYRADRLPTGWTVAPVYARFSVQLGKMLDEKRIVGTHLAPYLRNVDVQWGHINTADLPEMDFSEEDRERFNLMPGDLLVCEGGEVGRTAIWDGQLDECYYQKALHRMRPTTEHDEPRYFRYFMMMAVDAGLFALSTASTIQHLPAEKLRVVRYPAPPRSVQKAIADYLDRETARLDALVIAKERFLGLLAEKRRALITRAVTRGLDPRAPLRDSCSPWLGEIPAHWQVIRLKFVAGVQGGLALGKNYGSTSLVDLPYLRVANVQDGYLDLTDVATVMVPPNEAATCMLMAGDVLMNEGGDADKLGRGCVWSGEISPCLHQNHVFAVRPEPGGLLPVWLNLWTSSDGAKAYLESRAKQSTNLASISSRNIKEMPMPLPPLDEQSGIVAYVDRSCCRIDEVWAATEKTIDIIRERRSALIAAAVTGQLPIPPAGVGPDPAPEDRPC